MNKNTLNAQRLLQYFRKDWSENAAQLYYYFIIPYGIMTLLFHLDGFHQNALCGRGIGTSAARHGNRQQQLPTDYGERLVRKKTTVGFPSSSRPCCVLTSSWPLRAALFQDIKIPEGLHHRPDIPGFKCREVYCEMVQNLHHILPYLLFSHCIGRLHPYRFHPFPLSRSLAVVPRPMVK